LHSTDSKKNTQKRTLDSCLEKLICSLTFSRELSIDTIVRFR
jgi:hypothetical protein